MLPKRLVLDSWISTGTFAEFVGTILDMGAARSSAYVCCANVHMLVEAHQHPEFRRILDEASLVVPDGSPVAAAVGLFHGQRQSRVAGMDLLPALLAEAASREQSVYFYGTTEPVLAAMVARARREHPGLRVVGAYSPPFRPLTAEEDAAETAAINAADPDLLFVALGCPRQERWMAEHQGRIRSCMLGVGQAFPVYAGLEPRLPRWARQLWLEWAYRLWLEPRRLWRRYLHTNTKFVYLVGRRALSHLAGRPHVPA
ncbi:N-acetylglucosaminyldiphosphoundecaprenol N-acetyl-beta-D-mannosaminyltransferase [Hymenobacter daecheongensis DSM 21074]|uniref:N-acetylglucosaminyldiphosphoundecaprenol N-acetyl-beta-D-mannosaminyltransferase n=1 Tax=Hymenobacter daecheongensis DSM 21074 TaxID=1121955 RepID=A0A1M6KLJ1_9BACT|nr:WecB/TagA/CpsF family glycosyltransferase [Hymenobacter daecheongensis]SHJ59832.1 N-acetylglucosaminyldiphosphoundecaprenol N-acetyl-beta-D-mannosaminyltransferase [Hymenobacter daecheongensis DSM 21074]